MLYSYGLILTLSTANPHHDAAQSVLNLLRGRAKAEDVISHVESLKTSLETSDEHHPNVDGTVRSIVVQSLLHIGCRSFSHLLNAIERYLPLLRIVANVGPTGSGTQQAKAEILTSVGVFWIYNPQMVGIVFDKLMQYQIVDPTDVVDWIFVSGQKILHSESAITGNVSARTWDLLKAALDKANGRLVIARRKVAALRKEDDENRAHANANSLKMEVDDVKTGASFIFENVR